MKNKIFSLAVFVFCLALFGCTEEPETQPTNGNYEYHYGDFTIAPIEGGVLIRYMGPGGAVTIPSSVTRIGYGAFWGCTTLTAITIPNSVTKIGEWAFSECAGLHSVAMSQNTSSIGNNSFAGCTSLTTVTIPQSVSSIGNKAFAGCTNLTTVTFEGSTLNNFDDAAFAGDLKTVYIDGGAGTYIWDNVTSVWTKSP